MLGYSRYLDAIGDEVSRFIEVSRVLRNASVPTCPGWKISDLSSHLAAVYRHWSTQLLAADPGAHTTVPTVLHHESVAHELEHEETILLDRLGKLSEDAPCWNWSDGDYTALWVARRMALETAIHRIDAESASGRTTEIARDLSLDGIEEKFDVHLRLDVPENPTATLNGTICFICSDANHAWTLNIEHGQLRIRDGRGPASVALVGTASNLFQFVWNRIDLSRFEVTGDRLVAENWRELPC